MRVNVEKRYTPASDLFKPSPEAFVDLTDHGVCRDCGNCCGNILPITQDDYLRIRSYVDAHKIKPSKQWFLKGFTKPTVHNDCPFLLDKDEHRCAIYPVRPGICKHWTCHNPHIEPSLVAWGLRNQGKIKQVNMYATFFPEETKKEVEGIPGADKMHFGNPFSGKI